MFFLRSSLFLMFLLFSGIIKAQSWLPPADLSEIEKGKNSFSSMTCDDLAEKANDKSFSLNHLAALRAMYRCAGFSFDLSQLSDFEKKLYAGEILPALDSPTTEKNDLTNLSSRELERAIKKEKDVTAKYQLYLRLRQELRKRTQNKKDYLTASDRMLSWAQTYFRQHKKNKKIPAILYDAAQTNAKAHWTENDNLPALKALDSTLKLMKKKYSVAELYYLKGRIYEEMQKHSDAVSNYDFALQDIKKYKSSDLSFSTDRVLWLKAWILYKDQKYEEAQSALNDLAEQTQDLSEKSKARFFQARSLKNLKQPEKAIQILEDIIQNDFFGYYSLVSYHELGKKFPALTKLPPLGLLKFDPELKNADPTLRQMLKDLLTYNENTLAERLTILAGKTKDDDVNFGLYLARNRQIYMPLFRAFARLDNSQKTDLFLRYPEMIFPQPYKDEVSAMAEKTKLPTSLIYAIMKQESGFNERARSAADAFGLMQVIPRLAAQLAKKFNVTFYRDPLDLYKADTNIRLGSYELMQQVQKQNGQLSYVAAAYNAGPAALASWLKNRNREDIIEFIEEIPYEETRTYVKLITRNKIFYDRVSNRDSDLAFSSGFLD